MTRPTPPAPLAPGASGAPLDGIFLRLYSALMWVGAPFLRVKLARRGAAEPGYLQAVGERFGRYARGDAPVPASESTVWIHAVSLGETRAAAILLDALRERVPGMRLLLTHGTATGRAEGARLLRPGDRQAWLPWDTPGAVRRFLDQFNPRIGILMETEVWPNLAAQCRARGVPLVLANARLSDKSMQQALSLAPLSRPAYESLAGVWAQTQSDADRLREVGATVTGVLGNLKFDATPDAAQVAQGRQWRAAAGRPVVMFASSREGEELELLKVIRNKWPSGQLGIAKAATENVANANMADERGRSIQWLIVPRHPQRFDDVVALIERQGFSVSRRSAWGSLDGVDGAPPQADVWVGDTLGEMALYYGLSDVALLGGSFAPLGGQNLIEAAACGCPVVMGPHTFNFAEAAELAEAAGAALRVGGMEEAVTRAAALPATAAHDNAVQAATAFAGAHRGAARRTADAVMGLVVP